MDPTTFQIASLLPLHTVTKSYFWYDFFRFVLKKVELELYCFLDNNTGYRKRLNFRAKNVSTYFEQENKCSISVFTTIKLQGKRDNSPVTQVPQWCPNRS